MATSNLPALMALQTREFKRRYLTVPKAQWELEGGLLRILRALFRPAFNSILKRLRTLAAPNPNSDPVLLRPLQDLREPFGNAVGDEAVRAAGYGSDQLARQAKGAGFVVPDPTIPSVTANLIRSEAFRASEATLTRMTGDARESLARFFEQDLTVDEAAKELGRVFEGMLDHELRRIAQTEINSYRNRGSYELLLTAGIPYHQWLTVEDLRVRRHHSDIHGQVVRVGDRFENELLYPGDRVGTPPKQWVNCRCRHHPYSLLGRVPPAGKRFFFPRDLAGGSTVRKHLPGRHDQKTHGRRFGPPVGGRERRFAGGGGGATTSGAGGPSPEERRKRTEGLLRPGGRLVGEPGTSRAVRVMPGGLPAAEGLFGQLAELGEVEETPRYPGRLARLPALGTVGLRPASASGPPTLDVRIPGIRIREIKFPE